MITCFDVNALVGLGFINHGIGLGANRISELALRRHNLGRIWTVAMRVSLLPRCGQDHTRVFWAGSGLYGPEGIVGQSPWTQHVAELLPSQSDSENILNYATTMFYRTPCGVCLAEY